MKKKISLLLGMVLMFFCVAQAQIENPIKWKVDFNTTSDTEAERVFSATVEKGWHLYSTNIPDGGPVPTTINFDEKTGIELVGALTPVGKTVTLFEDAFGLDVTYFENEGKFVQKVKFVSKEYKMEGYLEYMACNDENCLPPQPVDFSYSGTADKVAAATAPVAEEPLLQS